GKSGFLVEEKDHRRISKRIVFLAKNRRERTRMGENARRDVVERFSWGAIGESYTSLFTKLTKKYYSLGVPKILNDRERLRVAKQIWGVISDKITNSKKLTCIDVGSSGGVIDNFLANYFKSVIGIDIDENAIGIAKNKFKKGNLKFVVGNIEKLNYQNNSVDVVVCNQVYNFVDNPKRLMNEIYRVLKSGGICYFGARNKFAFMEPQYDIPLGSWIPFLLPFGKNYMSFRHLKKLVDKFEIDDYTFKILKNPKKYGFLKLEKYSPIAKYFPVNLLYDFIPNYIWILTKN
ncbi:MAG TPA: methyltransferase domain-containing protein, partial [Nitrosopumilaceae archaeon]|nr:methyltransferase domain-containing protein [Nitrosopumilaceae archaeon]